MVLHFLNKQLERVDEFRFYLVLLTSITAVFTYTYLQFCLLMNHNFLLVACDTAAYQNTLVNLLHGNFFRDTAFQGPNLLGLHTFFILVFLMPIYALYQNPDTLYFLHIVGIYSIVIPVYFIAEDRLKNCRTAFIVGTVALMSPSLVVGVCSPFHPENWIPPALLWSYYFYLKDRQVLFWYALLFAFFCGEISAPVVSSMGLAILASQEQKADWSYGIRYLVAGIAWILFAQLVVLPIMHSPDQQDMVSFKYPDWHATSLTGLGLAIVTHPFKALTLLLSPARLYLYIQVLGLSTLLIPFFRRSLIIILPMPIFFLMSSQELYVDFHVYYFAYAYIAAYIALILFLKECPITSPLSIAVVTVIVLWNSVDLAAYTSSYEAIAFDQDATANRTIMEQLQKIPGDVAVYSPHRYSAVLSNRENMVMGDLVYGDKETFDSMVEARYSTTLVHADQIDFIVCDIITDQTGRRLSINTTDSPKRYNNLYKLVESGKWKVYWGSAEKRIMILCRADRHYQ